MPEVHRGIAAKIWDFFLHLSQGYTNFSLSVSFRSGYNLAALLSLRILSWLFVTSISITKALSAPFPKIVDLSSHELSALVELTNPFSLYVTPENYSKRTYVPLILLAIESEIGEALMWTWLKTILTSKPQFSNYSFLVETLSDALKDTQKFNHIRSTYFETPDALKNADNALNKKARG